MLSRATRSVSLLLLAVLSGLPVALAACALACAGMGGGVAAAETRARALETPYAQRDVSLPEAEAHTHHVPMASREPHHEGEPTGTSVAAVPAGLECSTGELPTSLPAGKRTVLVAQTPSMVAATAHYALPREPRLLLPASDPSPRPPVPSGRAPFVLRI